VVAKLAPVALGSANKGECAMTNQTTTATAATTTLAKIQKANLVAFLRNLNGKYAGIKFLRVAAKCPHCEKSNKAWNALDKCPICGTELSKFRTSTIQLGVANPAHCTVPGKGKWIGEGFTEALAKGNLKFFDPAAPGTTGGQGNYRTAKIDNIVSVKAEGVTYVVV